MPEASPIKAPVDVLLANELYRVEPAAVHRCPDCGAKITTTTCVECLIQSRKTKKANQKQG